MRPSYFVALLLVPCLHPHYSICSLLVPEITFIDLFSLWLDNFLEWLNRLLPCVKAVHARLPRKQQPIGLGWENAPKCAHTGRPKLSNRIF